MTCPLKVIDDDAFEAIAAAELAKKGSWPNGRGGWLDETHACVQAVRMVWNEQAYWNAELNIPNA